MSFKLSELKLKEKISYLKSYINATEREIRQLRTAKLKYHLLDKKEHEKDAEGKIRVRELNLEEAKLRLRELTVGEPESVIFT